LDVSPPPDLRTGPPRILFVASEVAGFAKSGGLADVVASLPRALALRGHSCVVVLPLYRCIRTGPNPLSPTEHRFQVPVGDRIYEGRLWRSTLPRSQVPVYLIDQPEFFDRDDHALGLGLYQFVASDGSRKDYPDNCARFVFFCRAVLEALPQIDFWPDVLHLNDWQTGLVPVYLEEIYRRHPDPDLRARFQALRTLFTIHNVAYQGRFPSADMTLTGLDWKLFNYLQLEFYGRLNFLKAGLVFGNLLTTVSPHYAREIQTPYFGEGLHTVLYERFDRLFGVINGADYEEWNPATDRHLAARYTPEAIQPGKPRCKAALQEHFGLAVEERRPLLGMVARLVEQKGVGLLVQAAEPLIDQGCQLVVLGEGDHHWHEALEDLRNRYPERVGLTLGFDDPLAHRIEAGADLFLMPSLYEPSGLSQLYSMKYGTVPVVRATGGLADTVTDCTPATLEAGTATGFCFTPPAASAFIEAVRRALAFYRGSPDGWLRLMHNGMRQDWSWDRSAAEYEALYLRLVAGSEE
jgi:starch synthase